MGRFGLPTVKAFDKRETVYSLHPGRFLDTSRNGRNFVSYNCS